MSFENLPGKRNTTNLRPLSGVELVEAVSSLESTIEITSVTKFNQRKPTAIPSRRPSLALIVVLQGLTFSCMPIQTEVLRHLDQLELLHGR